MNVTVMTRVGGLPAAAAHPPAIHSQAMSQSPAPDAGVLQMWVPQQTHEQNNNCDLAAALTAVQLRAEMRR
jgi:hypothetical protein